MGVSSELRRGLAAITNRLNMDHIGTMLGPDSTVMNNVEIMLGPDRDKADHEHIGTGRQGPYRD